MVNIKSVQDSLTELFIENTKVIFEGLYSLAAGTETQSFGQSP